MIRASLSIAWLAVKTGAAIVIAAFLWLYLLEGLGIGA
jgi:hypothetical protein